MSAGEAPESVGDAVGGKEPPVRGVMYVRMSTEHQQYSPENQRDVMAAYAAQRGIPDFSRVHRPRSDALREWAGVLLSMPSLVRRAYVCADGRFEGYSPSTIERLRAMV